MSRILRPFSLVEVNQYHFIMDIAWFGLALATTTRFLSVYAIRTGASVSQLTWMTALPALVLLIGSAFSHWWRTRYTDSKQAVFWPSFAFRISFFLLALTPLLPAAWQPVWLIITLTLTAIPQGVSGVIFLGLMRDSVAHERWTLLNSHRHMAMNATIGIGALAAGVWLEHVAFPLNYQIMFLGAFLATLISLWHVTRVQPIHTSPPQVKSVKSYRAIWQSKQLRKLILLIMLTHIPFFMVYPLVPLQLVTGLHAPEGFIALFGLVELAGGVLIAGFATGWIIRWSYKMIMAYAMIITGFAVGIIAMAPSLWLTLPAAALLGISWTLVGISALNVMTDNNEPEQTDTYNMVFIQSVGLATFIGPLLGNALVKIGLQIDAVLIVGAIIRFAAGWVIMSLKNDPTS